MVDPTDGTSVWFRHMWKDDPAFRERARQRWKSLRSGVWSDAALKEMIGGAVAALDGGDNSGGGAALRNYAKYADVLEVGEGQKNEGGYADVWMGYVNELQSWLLARVAWMDQELM